MLRTEEEILESIFKANGGERREDHIKFLKDKNGGLPLLKKIINEIESLEYARFEFPHTTKKRNPEPVPVFIFNSTSYIANSSDGQRLSFPVERAIRDEVAYLGAEFDSKKPQGDFEAWLAVKIIMSGWYIQKMDSFFSKMHSIRGSQNFETALKLARKETAKTLVMNLFSQYQDVISEDDIINFFREAEIEFVMNV